MAVHSESASLEIPNELSITVICDGYTGDSVRGEGWSIHLRHGDPAAHPDAHGWRVLGIQHAWWCWAGRGTGGWQSELCS